MECQMKTTNELIGIILTDYFCIRSRDEMNIVMTHDSHNSYFDSGL